MLRYDFSPFQGLEPFASLLGQQLDVTLAIAGLLIIIPVFLFIVYGLFPIFLYAGVLLRSFPWTRAAGGTLIALFIAFYIVFPSLLYPFTTYLPQIATGLQQLSASASGVQAIWQFSTGTVGALLPFVGGSFISSEVNGFAIAVSNAAVQLVGLVISFLISFDLVETFGDMLGSPSLQAKGLLSKVI
ncbi:MAG: hypothetical protein M1286_01145 [Candidatus Marsarchaeota archaeon]|nr:hypothetical protein [Candidatus Marsarchaeota archaeon]